MTKVGLRRDGLRADSSQLGLSVNGEEAASALAFNALDLPPAAAWSRTDGRGINMTLEELKSVLSAGGAINDGEWDCLPEGRTVTLHVACSGVGLTVARVVAVKFASPLLHARTSREELYVVSTADVFACAFDAGGVQGRKAGFVSS